MDLHVVIISPPSIICAHSCVAGSTFVLPRTALFPVHDVFGGAQTHIDAAQETHFGSCYAHFGWCPNTS
jgi:hypothetical protein